MKISQMSGKNLNRVITMIWKTTKILKLQDLVWAPLIVLFIQLETNRCSPSYRIQLENYSKIQIGDINIPQSWPFPKSDNIWKMPLTLAPSSKWSSITSKIKTLCSGMRHAMLLAKYLTTWNQNINSYMVKRLIRNWSIFWRIQFQELFPTQQQLWLIS